VEEAYPNVHWFLKKDPYTLRPKRLGQPLSKKSSEGGRSSISPVDETTAGSLLSARDDSAKLIILIQ